MVNQGNEQRTNIIGNEKNLADGICMEHSDWLVAS